jgi:hypothetical protein
MQLLSYITTYEFPLFRSIRIATLLRKAKFANVDDIFYVMYCVRETRQIPYLTLMYKNLSIRLRICVFHCLSKEHLRKWLVEELKH